MPSGNIVRKTSTRMAMIAFMPLCLLAACGEKAPQGAESVTVDTQTPPTTEGAAGATNDAMAPSAMPGSAADGSSMGAGSMTGGTTSPATIEPNTTDSVTTATPPGAAGAGTGTGTGNTNAAGDVPR